MDGEKLDTAVRELSDLLLHHAPDDPLAEMQIVENLYALVCLVHHVPPITAVARFSHLLEWYEEQQPLDDTQDNILKFRSNNAANH